MKRGEDEVLAIAMATLQLLVVQGLKPAGNVGLEVTFHTKERAILRSTHGDYQYYEGLLQRSCDRQRPVGVSVRDGEIQEVSWADQDVVMQLVERDRPRVDVWFMGHDGLFHFDRSDPHAQRIGDTLARSKKFRSRVWFVALRDLRIVDVAFEDELPRIR